MATCRLRQPTRSALPSASPAWPRSGRCRAARRGGRTRCIRSSTTSPTRQVRMHCAQAWTPCSTTTPSHIRVRSRGSYSFSSLANFLTGAYSGFTQTFGDPVVSQTNPNVGMYAQDEWRVGARLTMNLGPPLRPAVPAADQHRYEQRLAARRVRVVAVGVARPDRSRQCRAVLRSRSAPRGRQRDPLGREHDRPDAGCSSRACRDHSGAGRRARVSRTFCPPGC